MSEESNDRVRSIVAVGLIVLGVVLVAAAIVGLFVAEDVDLSGVSKLLAVIIGALVIVAGVSLRFGKVQAGKAPEDPTHPTQGGPPSW